MKKKIKIFIGGDKRNIRHNLEMQYREHLNRIAHSKEKRSVEKINEEYDNIEKWFNSKYKDLELDKPQKYGTMEYKYEKTNQ